MRSTEKASCTGFFRISGRPTSRVLSYENLARAMAAKMRGLLRSADPLRLFPPFQVVILCQRGSVVFEGEVNKNGKVRHGNSAQAMRRSHFPATVFVTDRSQTTRTFQIERAASVRA